MMVGQKQSAEQKKQHDIIKDKWHKRFQQERQHQKSIVIDVNIAGEFGYFRYCTVYE